MKSHGKILLFYFSNVLPGSIKGTAIVIERVHYRHVNPRRPKNLDMIAQGAIGLLALDAHIVIHNAMLILCVCVVFIK